MGGQGVAYEIDTRSGFRRSRRSGAEFRLFSAIAILLFIVPVALSRLFLPSRFGTADGGGHRSIFDEARARADKIVPFIFMG